MLLINIDSWDMNNKLIDKKIEIHKEQFKRLNEIEEELTEMISKINDDALHEKFIDWLNQRSRCNETYIAIQDAILTTKQR